MGAESACLGARTVECCSQVGVDRALTVDGAELSVLGDLDGCCELGVESATFEGDLSDPVVERLVGELDQLVEEIAEHAAYCSKQAFDRQACDLVVWSRNGANPRLLSAAAEPLHDACSGDRILATRSPTGMISRARTATTRVLSDHQRNLENSLPVPTDVTDLNS